ncbi:unnamed protein product [Brachionus calyciflorus]|uniref:Ribosome biogenesis protein NOP53 n=1 Tax=Brachionus calyciflorus TaxID=104777 RepID=A0A813P6T0_9BILA|nr:unnamed protein product [Brachionus calyciflorus]
MLTLNLEDQLSKDNGESGKKKKQKLVKHRRKNWKKTDIAEVEQGIEDLRQQQRSGGVLSEKKDEDLFYIHKEKIPNEISEEEIQPRKKQRLSLEEKLSNLKCYKNLQPDPASYPAHIVNDKKKPDETSKRQQKLKERRTKLLSVKKRTQKLSKKDNEKENTVILNDIVKKKRKVKTVILRPDDRKNVILAADFERDIWNKNEEPVINEVNEYHLRGTKQLKVKRPENPILPKTALPKVELPHPGASYNPDYDDHQELLLKAHLIELEKLKQEQKEMKKFTNTVKKMSWDAIEKLWLEEMAVDSLFNQDNQEIDEDDNGGQVEADASNNSSKKSKKNDSKSKRKRKQLLDKIKLKQKENEKQQRVQQNEIYRLKSIKKEISDEEKKREEERLKNEIEEKHKELFMPKRLGPLKYEDPEIELKLSNEITGNLRNLKPEGNILLDRYKSLQKRNIIEPREKAKSQRKYWKKTFEKKNAYEKTHYIK